jgi:hypothetical protein
MMIEEAYDIASLFDVPEPIDVSDFPAKGNINQNTFSVMAGPPADRREYILQQLNPEVFTRPRAVMNAMILCIQAQQNALSEGALAGGEEWETIRLIPAKNGEAYLEISDSGISSCWRMMARIGNSQGYKSLREIPDSSTRLKVAGEAGRGLALFGTLTAGMDPSLIDCPLPGYRDTGLYYDQLHSVLEGNQTLEEASRFLPSDPMLRRSTGQHFIVHIPHDEYRSRLEDPQLRRYIDLALERKPFALKLVRALADGELKRVVVHGDTKLENFLFSAQTGKVKSLVDMDTIMPHTWLSDWGDMVRSLVNPAGEKEQDLSKIKVDAEVFEAVARGFFGSAHHVPPYERGFMTDAVQIMALELGVRFLADYLRGDNYFMLKQSDPRDLNKIRAMVQFCLFEDLRAKSAFFESLSL